LVDRADIQAWVRGTQSLIEYYAGSYREALELAIDGQRVMPGGPQSIRLLVNGEARALGRLDDEAGVKHAIERALGFVEDSTNTETVSASLSRSTYCETRLAGNAATALLSLGRPKEAFEYAAKAVGVFDREGLRGPQALCRLDMAAALAQQREGNVEQVAGLLREALQLAATTPFESILQRTSELLASTPGWRDTRPMKEIEELHRTVARSSGMDTQE
jgi:tetratricopeptide (TPR) repeat protein